LRIFFGDDLTSSSIRICNLFISRKSPDPVFNAIRCHIGSYNDGNKKGRREIAPTVVTSLPLPVPVHPWSKAESDCDNSERQNQSALMSNADKP
jgi:hypothetical protein